MAVYRDCFGNAGDFTFYIVGAASPGRIKPLVERHIASLPSTRRTETADDVGLRPWTGLKCETSEVFEVPKASTMLVFDGAFPAGADEYVAERRRLNALAWTLQLKLTEQLREQMGGTYGASV